MSASHRENRDNAALSAEADFWRDQHKYEERHAQALREALLNIVTVTDDRRSATALREIAAAALLSPNTEERQP